jgi:hypothetical protein
MGQNHHEGKGIKMQRLILQSVNVSGQAENGYTATVVLHSGDEIFTGESVSPVGEDNLCAVALATLEAVRKYLPMPVQFQLKKAAKMQHENINDDLMIVTVDFIADNGERSVLTGSCLSKGVDIMQDAAKATLDATNRIITFLLQQDESNPPN